MLYELYGSELVEAAPIKRLETKKNLLQWPSGTPGAADSRELGWHSFLVEVRRVQFSFLGRLCIAYPLMYDVRPEGKPTNSM